MLDELIPESLDIKRAPARKVAERLLALRAAGESARAARRGLPRYALHRRIAHGAAARQLDGSRAFWPTLDAHLHDFRNHIPGTAHHHGVAHSNIVPLNLIHIVQRHVTHGRAAYEYRLQARDRRQCSGASHLELHI